MSRLAPHHLEQLSNLRAHTAELVCRRGGFATPFQDLLLALAALGSDEEISQAMALPRHIKSAWEARKKAAADEDCEYEPLEWPAGDTPWEQAHRLATAVFKAKGKGKGQVIEPADLTGPRGALTSLRTRWLLGAAERAMLHYRASDPDEGPVLHTKHVQLAVLLYDGVNKRGQVAQLRLYAVPERGARLALVAAPASAFTPITASFAQALERVTQWLQAQCTDTQAHDTALAWDISLPEPEAELIALDGPSAGAAFALGAAWLLRDLLPEGELRRQLNLMTRPNLADTYVSATLEPLDGEWLLGTVGHVPEKVEALKHAHQRDGKQVLVYAAQDEAQGLRKEGISVQDVDSILALAQAVAKRSNTLTESQRLLLDALAHHDPLDQQPPQLTEPVLTAVALRDPVKTRVQYALQRWAWWALVLKGQLHNRFVPLRIVPDGANLPEGMRPSATPHAGLEQLLADNPGSLLSAYLLRGSPGAGKSTVLQHHEQTLCRTALQRWLKDGRMTELPLYLPLSGLPADEKAPAWLHRTLKEQYPQCQPLLDLLHPSTRGEHDPVLQLMFDGLNELPTPDHQSPNQRVVQVLEELQRALKPQLPMLLSARTHHVFDLRKVGYVAPVDVLPWADDEMQAYIGRRFPQDLALATTLWGKLKEQPHALELCRTPFNLNGQCNLWQGGSTHVSSHRADLYARLLWQALVRELNREDGWLSQHPHLLSPRDKEVLLEADALNRPQLPAWPRQGVLLDSLFRQGKAQWFQLDTTHPDLPATARGAVELPWDDPQDTQHPAHPRSVAHWLKNQADSGLRHDWRKAVQELGLLDDFQPHHASGNPDATRRHDRFKWRHQSWGEYLASVDLLKETPEAMPATELQDLLQRLRAHRGFEGGRNALEELEHQRQLVIQRWDLPHIWPKVLEEGITVSRNELRQWFRIHLKISDRDIDQLGKAGLWAEDVLSDTWVVNVKTWGELFGVSRAIGLSGAWYERPDGWQCLVMDTLPPLFRDALWERLNDAPLVQRLKDQPGHLPLRSAGALDEVLGLALLARPLPALRTWLRWLVTQDLWPALAPCLQDLARLLEPAGAWPTGGEPLDATLQHLRRCLLLTSVDAGPEVRSRVAASGLLTLLQDDAQGLGAEDPLATHWQHQWQQAFTAPGGQDLRIRLEAALLLGRALGDNLRYERAQVKGTWHPGLRLKPALWADLGSPGQSSAYGIGSGPHDRDARSNEQDAFERTFEHFQLARFAVTVGEWQRFVDSGGYEDRQAPWWSVDVVGKAGQIWLNTRAKGTPTSPVRPYGWGAAQLNNPLQPVTGITLFEALAYAAWAAPIYLAAESPDLQLAVPSEALWEAGMRGPLQGPFNAREQAIWLYPTPAAGPGPLDFNHANTRWGRPSPVGVFSTSYTPHGVADAQGNTWDWCCNIPVGAYDEQGQQAAAAPWNPADTTSNRALRGGGCYSGGNCRVAIRGRRPPGGVDSSTGLRLVRCVLPHSEP